MPKPDEPAEPEPPIPGDRGMKPPSPEDDVKPLPSQTRPAPSETGRDKPFVRAKDLVEPSGSEKAPTEPGFMAEMIVGAGGSLRETEAAITGDYEAFKWTQWDEKIWRGAGRWVETQLDPTKYGPIVLLITMIGNELSHIAVYAKNHPRQPRPQPGREQPPPGAAGDFKVGPGGMPM